MSVLWLLLLLPISVVTEPPSTTEGKLDLSQDLTPVHPLAGNQGGEMKAERTTPAPQVSGSILGPSRCLPEQVPCVDDQQHPHEALGSFLLALRDGWNKQSELGKEELARFGICSHSDDTQLQQLLDHKAHEEPHGLGCFHIEKEHWEVEENGKFMLTLHFTRPCKRYQQSPPTSIILLFFVGSIKTEGMNVKFSSHGLQPNKQTVCVSKDTQFLALTTDQAEIFSHGHLKLRIVIDSQNQGQKMALAEFQAMLVKKDTKTSIPLSPVLLSFPLRNKREQETLSSSRTFLFLCELQKFLNEVLPQKDPALSVEEEATTSQIVLHSLPPLTLGMASSESLLLELINFSGPTAFSFPRHSLGMQNHRVELTLNPVQLSVLRQRLDEAVAQVQTEKDERSVTDRLHILTALTKLPDGGEGAEAGLENPREVNYRALLLLKALQTMLAVERAQRAVRADQEGPTKPSHCRLHSLTVSLEKYLLEPPTANINNCQGTCGFPLTNSNNHAILLNSHLQSGQPLNRTLCCVPVDYDDLCVIELDSEGTTISYKTNMIAKKCECR